MIPVLATAIFGIPVVTFLFVVTLIIFVLDFCFGFWLAPYTPYAGRAWALCFALWSIAFIYWHLGQ